MTTHRHGLCAWEWGVLSCVSQPLVVLAPLPLAVVGGVGFLGSFCLFIKTAANADEAE